jgi:hypothetical protein
MKAILLIVAIFVSLKLFLLLLAWCATHLPMEASVVVSCVGAYAIFFGLCGSLAKQLGIY